MQLADLEVPDKERHAASALAWVPHGKTGPTWLAAAQWSWSRLRSRAFALQADGTVVGETALEGTAYSVAVGRFTPGEHGAAVAAGLGVYALEARQE